MNSKIKEFFNSPAFAVIGASSNRTKFGNKVLRAYLQNNLIVYPVNPHEQEIEGLICIPSVNHLPTAVKSISIVTPPAVTEQVVDQAIQQGILNIWLQPGAESEIAIRHCKLYKVNVIAKGPCVLVALNFRED